MKYHVAAYDQHGLQVLGNLDGQGIFEAKQFNRCNWFKRLNKFKTLNNRIEQYKIFKLDCGPYGEGTLVTTVFNNTFKERNI